jgi:hypothetical protein
MSETAKRLKDLYAMLAMCKQLYYACADEAVKEQYSIPGGMAATIESLEQIEDHISKALSTLSNMVNV